MVDDNRARVVESKALSSFIIGCFKHGPLLPFAVAATLNLCVDYSMTASGSAFPNSH